MIDLGSVAGLHEHGHQLAAYCPRCDAWRVLRLDEMVAHGKGLLRLPLRVRCRDCGEFGRLQVRPPMPSHPRSIGWMETTMYPADADSRIPMASLCSEYPV